MPVISRFLLKAMFQVTFSDQSMDELNKLEMSKQLELVEQISGVTLEQLSQPREPLSKFSRGGTTFYRLRAGGFRCYFEVDSNSLYNHYILHKNTLSDFVFRSKLPLSEDLIMEQDQSFWKYLNSLKKNSK